MAVIVLVVKNMVGLIMTKFVKTRQISTATNFSVQPNIFQVQKIRQIVYQKGLIHISVIYYAKIPNIII